MMSQIVLDIPDEALEQARRVASHARQSVEEYLSSQLARQLSPLSEPAGSQAALQSLEMLDLSGLSDEQLRVHIFAELDPKVQDRLSELQRANNEGALSEAELAEFDRLLLVGHTSTMLKAQALLAWKKRHGALPADFRA